jgi:2'-5' RNA ligase
MEIRSFLAFELPPEIKTMVTGVFEDCRRSRLDVRWVRPEGIHLTVVFMGNIKTDDLEDMGSEVGRVCSNFSPFQIALKGIGCFPNSRNPRVIWLGLDGDVDRMSRFRDRLQEQLLPFGIQEEKRPFRPHLTLGRFKKPSRDEGSLRKLMEKHEDLTSPVCTLDEFIFFRSELKPGGAVYTKMLSWPLSETGGEGRLA